MELKDYRDRLDRIDDEIAALFQRRMETVAEIAACKKTSHSPVLAAEREAEILRRVTGLVDGELREYAETLYQTLMALSRSYQTRLLADAAGTGEEPGGADEGC